MDKCSRQSDSDRQVDIVLARKNSTRLAFARAVEAGAADCCSATSDDEPKGKTHDRPALKVKFQPEKTEQVMAALRVVIAPARGAEGVIRFDIARDLTDPNSFIATEVFEDEAARERQESLP